MGKPPQRITRHSSLLSLSHPLIGRFNEYAAKSRRLNRHIAWYTSPYTGDLAGLGNQCRRRPTGSGSALRAYSRRCSIQIHIYITYLLTYLLTYLFTYLLTYLAREISNQLYFRRQSPAHKHRCPKNTYAHTHTQTKKSKCKHINLKMT